MPTGGIPFHSSRVIASYAEAVADMDDDKYAEIWDTAWEYNRSLIDRPNDFLLSEAQKENYEALLNIDGNGIMGYIEIPAIDLTLPVYHGTNSCIPRGILRNCKLPKRNK